MPIISISVRGYLNRTLETFWFIQLKKKNLDKLFVLFNSSNYNLLFWYKCLIITSWYSVWKGEFIYSAIFVKRIE